MPAVASPVLRSRRAPDAGSALDAVFFHISRAFYAYVRQLEILLEETGLDEHLRPGMGQVLFALFEDDDVIIKSLVERTRLAPSTLGRLVRQMEQQGLVTCSQCDQDGRAVRVGLTELGRSLEPRCREILDRLTALTAADMRPAELRALKQGLNRVVTNLKD